MSTDDPPVPPSWIGIVGTIVAVGGLAYTWLSRFNPKVEPAKPSAAAAPALVDPADAARKAGRFEDAERLLKPADDMAVQDALKLQDQARESTRQLARVRATRGNWHLGTPIAAADADSGLQPATPSTQAAP